MISDEQSLKNFYTYKNFSGIQTIFTPKVIRDKLTVYAKPDMNILVLFNFELCYDLAQMGIANVTFASDDEELNSNVNAAYGYRVELINPGNIIDKLKGMKFDLILSNPPYNNNLDLKILVNVLELSDNICFVHPAGWLLKSVKNKKNKDYRDYIGKRLKSSMMFDGNDVFKDIKLWMPCVINLFTRHENKSIEVIDKSLYYSENVVNYSVNDIYEINKYGWYKNIKSIESKIKSVQNIGIENWRGDAAVKSKKGEISLGVAFIRGNVKNVDFTSIVQKNYDKHRNHNYDFGWTLNSEDEALNLYNYFKTKFARFCFSFYQSNNALINFIHYIPKFNFDKSYTDEQYAKALGITDEELLWMIQQIPNYYPEDEEKYKKLEEKLKTVI